MTGNTMTQTRCSQNKAGTQGGTSRHLSIPKGSTSASLNALCSSASLCGDQIGVDGQEQYRGGVESEQ